VTPRELTIALLLAAAGLAAWWYRGGRQAELGGPLPPGQPDYVVEQVAALSMSAAGTPERRLFSPQLRHYPERGGSVLETPVLHLLDTDAPDWVIRAERAWVAEDTSEVLMEGRVHAERDADAGSPPLRIQTSELLVLNDASYAETDRFVELERGADWLTAVDGMQLWFEEPMRSRFFGRVRQRMQSAGAPATDNEAGDAP
jgi:lipopolysaccharide export system protein LptC